ncbi:MAG: hypothetical protein ACRC62_26015 [Microcoleus sp.]
MAAPATGIDALPTLEAQLQRIILIANERELSMPVESRLNNFGVTYDFEALTASFTISAMPITIATTAGGKLEVTPTAFPALP